MTDEVLTRARVDAIAKALAGTCHDHSNDHGYSRAHVSTGAGLPIFICYVGYTKRIKVSVDWPTYRDTDGNRRVVTARDVLAYRETCPTIEISCAPDRADEVIARDIARRLIPHALPIYQAAVKRGQEHEEAANTRVSTRNRLAKALGIAPRDRDTMRLYAGSAVLEVNSGESVAIERVYVSPDTALAIVKLIQADKSNA